MGVRALLGRTEFKQSLQGATPAEVREQHRTLLDDWDAQIATARAKRCGDLRQLTNQEILAICGEWYREQVALYEQDPGNAESWSIIAAVPIDRAEDRDETDRCWSNGPRIEPNRKELAEADEFLRSRSLAVTGDPVRRFAVARWEANVMHAQLVERRAKSEYSADAYACRIPDSCGVPDA